MVEIATGAAFAVCVGKLGLTVAALKYSVYCAIMIALIASYGMEESQAAQLMSSDPVLITEVLASVRRHHGSVESYLVAHGVSLEEIDALRHQLLEAPPGEGATAPFTS